VRPLGRLSHRKKIRVVSWKTLYRGAELPMTPQWSRDPRHLVRRAPNNWRAFWCRERLIQAVKFATEARTFFRAEAQQLLEKRLGGIDRLACWWGYFTSKLTPPYTVKELEKIISRTRFESGEVTEGRWMTVKLIKKQG
jgi:hypothetical protein